jgi:hypothetical protein
MSLQGDFEREYPAKRAYFPVIAEERCHQVDEYYYHVTHRV